MAVSATRRERLIGSVSERLAELRQLFGDRLLNLVAGFLHSTPPRLAAMEAGLQAGDRQQLKESARAIRSSAANMAATLQDGERREAG